MDHSSTNTSSGDAFTQQEHVVGRFLDSLPFSRYHLTLVVVLGLVGMLEAYDTAITGSLAVSANKALNLAPYKALFVIAPTVGLIISLFVASVFVSDRVSRKKILLIGITWSSFFTLLTAFVPNVEFLVIARFVSGFGYGLTLPACYPLATELVPPKHRATFGSVYEVLLGLSFVMTSVVGIFIHGIPEGWRIIPLIGGVFLVILPPLVYYLVPESPRWLVSQHKYAHAYQVLSTFARRSGVDHTSVPDVGRLSHDSAASTLNDNAQQAGTRTIASFGLLFNPGVLRGTALAIIAWTCALVPYYIFSTLLPSILEHKGFAIVASLGFSALIFAVSIPGKILDGFMMEWIGRRTTIICCLLASVVGLLVTIFVHSIVGVIVGEVIIGVSVLSVFPAVRILMTEQFPTKLRGRGYFFSEWVGRFIAGIPIPFLLANQLNKPNLILGVVIAFVLIGAIATFVLGRDTRGRLESVTQTSEAVVKSSIDVAQPQQDPNLTGSP